MTSDLATRAERLRRLSDFQRRFSALLVDDAVPASHGRLAAAAAAAGQQPRAIDLLIAATAHVHSARPCTRNATGLVGVEDLIEIVPV